MKKDRLIIIWLIILIIIVLSGSGVMLYQDYFKENKLVDTKTNDNKKTLTKEDIEAYLSYVPTIEETVTEEDYGYSKDAYSSNKETVNTLDERLLMQEAFYISGRCGDRKIIVTDYCPEGCEADDLVLASEFNKNIKELYNIDKVTNTSFRVQGGGVFFSGKYYGLFMGAGSTPYGNFSEIIKYEEVNDELIIYEKAGFVSCVDEYDASKCVISKCSNDKEIIKKYTDYYDSDNDFDTELYFKEHLDEFYTFKHTFKPHDNGNYYWYSTEVEK